MQCIKLRLRICRLLADPQDQFVVAADLATVDSAAAPQRNELLQKNRDVVHAQLAIWSNRVHNFPILRAGAMYCFAPKPYKDFDSLHRAQQSAFG